MLIQKTGNEFGSFDASNQKGLFTFYLQTSDQVCSMFNPQKDLRSEILKEKEVNLNLNKQQQSRKVSNIRHSKNFIKKNRHYISHMINEGKEMHQIASQSQMRRMESKNSLPCIDESQQSKTRSIEPKLFKLNRYDLHRIGKQIPPKSQSKKVKVRSHQSTPKAFNHQKEQIRQLKQLDQMNRFYIENQLVEQIQRQKSKEKQSLSLSTPRASEFLKHKPSTSSEMTSQPTSVGLLVLKKKAEFKVSDLRSSNQKNTIERAQRFFPSAQKKHRFIEHSGMKKPESEVSEFKLAKQLRKFCFRPKNQRIVSESSIGRCSTKNREINPQRLNECSKLSNKSIQESSEVDKFFNLNTIDSLIRSSKVKCKKEQKSIIVQLPRDRPGSSSRQPKTLLPSIKNHNPKFLKSSSKHLYSSNNQETMFPIKEENLRSQNIEYRDVKNKAEQMRMKTKRTQKFVTL